MAINKKEIVAKATLNETYRESFSSQYFNVYRVSVAFEGYYLQFAFRVRPKNRYGGEWCIDYWFGDIGRCIKFMGSYKKFHTMEYWAKHFVYSYSMENVIFYKWVTKQVLITDNLNF